MSILNFKIELNFQASVTPIMEGIIDLHNHIFFFLILVFVFVFWIFGNILYTFWWKVNFPKNEKELSIRFDLSNLRHLSHNTRLEVIWTIFPSFILIAIAIPSFALLYAMDEIIEPGLTLKIVGHQWYWSYQYSNCISQLEYNSLNYPELILESLWNKVWSNAAFFYNNIIFGDLEHVGNKEVFPNFGKTPILVDFFNKVPFKKSDFIFNWNLYKEIYNSNINEKFLTEFFIIKNSVFYNKNFSKSVENFDICSNINISSKFKIYKEGLFLFSGLNKLVGFDLSFVFEIYKNQKNSVDLLLNFGVSEEKVNFFNKFLNDITGGNRNNFVYPFFHNLGLKLELPTYPVGFYSLNSCFFEFWARKFLVEKVIEDLSLDVNLKDKGSFLPGVQFDSYMLSEEELLQKGDYRLLEVDEPIVLPINMHIRLLIAADDVLHSFAVPSLGVKVDAVPGRLNQQGIFIKRKGTFYGQCSEICGVNHGFMPIVIKAVTMKDFVHWYLHKFDSLFPEYEVKLADYEEVSQFFEKGIYPKQFFNKF